MYLSFVFLSFLPIEPQLCSFLFFIYLFFFSQHFFFYFQFNWIYNDKKSQTLEKYALYVCNMYSSTQTHSSHIYVHITYIFNVTTVNVYVNNNVLDVFFFYAIVLLLVLFSLCKYKQVSRANGRMTLSLDWINGTGVRECMCVWLRVYAALLSWRWWCLQGDI